MEKRFAKHKGFKNVYVHNDLATAAFHFKQNIQVKLAASDKRGIAFEYMACLLMSAFALEAQLNFIGQKLILGWKERQPFDQKVDEILARLNVTPDWNSRPYKTIGHLKKFRDVLAHGKPVETEFDEVIEVANGTSEKRLDLDAEWVKYCDHETVFNVYDDVDKIWKELLEKSGIEVSDTLTHGGGEIVRIKS